MVNASATAAVATRASGSARRVPTARAGVRRYAVASTTSSSRSNSSTSVRPLHGARSRTGNAALRMSNARSGRRQTATAAAASTPPSTPGNTGNVTTPHPASSIAGSHSARAARSPRTASCAGTAGRFAGNSCDTPRATRGVGSASAAAGGPLSSAVKNRCASQAAAQAISTLVGSGWPRTMKSLPASTTTDTASARPAAVTPLRRAAHAATPIGA